MLMHDRNVASEGAVPRLTLHPRREAERSRSHSRKSPDRLRWDAIGAACRRRLRFIVETPDLRARDGRLLVRRKVARDRAETKRRPPYGIDDVGNRNHGCRVRRVMSVRTANAP